jgi:predicted GIY-YIG superfamily endonuclease
MTYVYFIQQGYGSIKIGVSDDPEIRLKQMQTGTSRILRIIAKFPFANRTEAFNMEKQLHVEYAYLRTTGEWFKRRLLHDLKAGSKRIIGGTSKHPVMVGVL